MEIFLYNGHEEYRAGLRVVREIGKEYNADDESCMILVDELSHEEWQRMSNPLRLATQATEYVLGLGGAE